jgi:hypothetical protein
MQIASPTNVGICLPDFSTGFPTAGPINRYGTVLYIEKEGFLPLLQRARLAEQYDMAIMSSKGMGTTAARTLARRGQIMVHKIKECEDASARASAVGGRRRVTGNWPTRSQHRQTSSKRGLVFDWTLFVLLRPFF